MREYHLHKDAPFKLQFEVHDAASYCKKHAEHCYKAHRHTFYQIIWFQEAGTHYIDYQDFDHPANTIFFLNTGQVHRFCLDSPNMGYLLHFNRVFLSGNELENHEQIQYRVFNEMGNPYIPLREEELPHYTFLLDRLQAELKDQAFNYKQQLFHYFQVLLLDIERCRRKNSPPIESDPNFELATKFKLLVDQHKHEFQSLSFFSDQMGISERTLSTISKKYLQETPANFIHQARVLEAKRLLSNTHLAIKEIAYKLGFDQATYFTKYFKKYTGLTPKDFQRGIQ